MAKMLSMKSATPLKLAIVASTRTQRDVAAVAGVDEVSFSRIVNGHRTPSVVVAVAIAKALDCRVEQLWPGQGTASDQDISEPNRERLAA